ncbi:MAG: hypothetical protein AAGA50_18345 [Pseudomonadota bacterium]
MSIFKKFLSKFATLNTSMGEVVHETPKISGEVSNAYIQVRLKEKLSEDEYVVGIKFKPDMYAGPEGSPTNYLNLNIEKAKRLKKNLEICIERHEELIAKRN